MTGLVLAALMVEEDTQTFRRYLIFKLRESKNKQGQGLKERERSGRRETVRETERKRET